MAPIRVLIVDDSMVVRRILTDLLGRDESVQVAGTAADGKIALAKIEQLKPDLVTLDIEMPGMSGLETLAEIRKLYRRLPVIMFSTLTERGASTTLEALSLGASDYATKPSNTGSQEATAQKIKEELIPKIKALCGLRTRSQILSSVGPAIAPQAPAWPGLRRTGQRIDVLAIGTSTGGPNALMEVLPRLPADLPVPVVLVQHMPPIFTRLLAERLDKTSGLSVREGVPGEKVVPGVVWIAPGDYHMTVEKGAKGICLAMNQDPPENSCRPAVDVLFRSVARVYGGNVLAVVLTGMGSDGVLGSQQIREAGGHVIVQDEASSVVWGMPGQVAAAGHADGIYPLEKVAEEITRRIQHAAMVQNSKIGAVSAQPVRKPAEPPGSQSQQTVNRED
jgi:two-component system chemotaxis response regulator CheB